MVVKPVRMAPRVEVPPACVVFQSIVTYLSMFIEEQKILGKFLRLYPPRFSSASSEDAYKLLVIYEDRLYNFVLISTHGF